MNDKKFLREISNLVFFVREYGVLKLNYPKSKEDIFRNPNNRDDFFRQVHTGFYLAQDRVAILLKKNLTEQKLCKKEIADANRNKDKELAIALKNKLKTLCYRERILRKVIDSIAWQMFHYDLSTMRQLYCGNEPIDITDSNFASEITYIEHFKVDHPNGFALISDLSSFIQIGDIVSICDTDGLVIAELKEGETNNRVFDYIQKLGDQSLDKKTLFSKLQEEDTRLIEHLNRTFNQLVKSANTIKTVSTGYGTDSQTGVPIIINKNEIVLKNYGNQISKLFDACSKKGYAITVIEDCLLVGLYDVEKMPSKIFDYWATSVGVHMKTYDYRSSFYDPLSFPVFLHNLSTKNILDLISGKKELKIVLNIEKWLDSFRKDGCEIQYLSRKKSARIINENRIGNYLLLVDGQSIEIKKGSNSIKLGQGIFSRMYSGFTLPSSIKEMLMLSLNSTLDNKNALKYENTASALDLIN